MNINTNFLNPNIMGSFFYIPCMECNHAILSMQNRTQGLLDVNNNKINFNDSIGYIEKDCGRSFPKSYIWCQGNCFQKTNICRLETIIKRQILLIVFLHRAEPYRNAMRKARRCTAAYLQLQGL